MRSVIFLSRGPQVFHRGGAQSRVISVASNKLCSNSAILKHYWFKWLEARTSAVPDWSGLETTSLDVRRIATLAKHVSLTCGFWQLSWTTLKMGGLRSRARCGPGKRWAFRWKRSCTTKNPSFRMLWFLRGENCNDLTRLMLLACSSRNSSNKPRFSCDKVIHLWAVIHVLIRDI